MPILATVSPLFSEDGKRNGWVAVAADLTERERAEYELRQREAILGTVAFAADAFLKSSDWRNDINLVLERLGKTIRATHAYLFENHSGSHGEALTSMRYEWTASGYPSDLGGTRFQNSLVEKRGYEDHVEKLKKGDVRMGNSSTFGSIEKTDMDEFGVKAILEVPVFVNGQEWGVIGFDDMENERDWSMSEVEALKIAAGVLGGAIQRQETESVLRESERIYRQAIQAAGAIPYYLDYRKHTYTFMGEKIEELTGYSSSELTPELWEEMEIERYPRGSMEHLTYSEADRLTEKGVLRHWECDYLIANRQGQEKWVSDSCVHVLDDNDVRIGVVGILQDITDRKLIEARLRKRESILEAITFSAEQFLKVSDWRTSINAVLERLGREFKVSHAYLFEDYRSVEGSVLHSMKYECRK